MNNDSIFVPIVIIFIVAFIFGWSVGMGKQEENIYKAGAIEYYLDAENNKQWRAKPCTDVAQ